MRSRKVIVSCSAVIFLKEMGFLQFKKFFDCKGYKIAINKYARFDVLS